MKSPSTKDSFSGRLPLLPMLRADDRRPTVREVRFGRGEEDSAREGRVCVSSSPPDVEGTLPRLICEIEGEYGEYLVLDLRLSSVSRLRLLEEGCLEMTMDGDPLVWVVG